MVLGMFISCLALFLPVPTVMAQYSLPSINESVAQVALQFLKYQLPPDSNIGFWLLTRKNLHKPQISYFDEIFNLNFTLYDARKKTVVLVHGYADDDSKDTILSFYMNIYPEFLLKQDCNVILVDWFKIAKHPNYKIAPKNIILAGWVLTKLIHYLRDKASKDAMPFHIVALDLGVLVVGAAKNFVRIKAIEKITALDPPNASLYPVKRYLVLDKTSVEILEVIHTCGGYNGTMTAMGHRDFYIEGGTWPQPGCGLDKTGLCSIFRAMELYKEAIVTSEFKATYCQNYENYQEGLCDENPKLNLYNTASKDSFPQGKYYISFNKKV